jgi:hypothetical protein
MPTLKEKLINHEPILSNSDPVNVEVNDSCS